LEYRQTPLYNIDSTSSQMMSTPNDGDGNNNVGGGSPGDEKEVAEEQPAMRYVLHCEFLPVEIDEFDQFFRRSIGIGVLCARRRLLPPVSPVKAVGNRHG